jgi:hypothetical protein
MAGYDCYPPDPRGIGVDPAVGFAGDAINATAPFNTCGLRRRIRQPPCTDAPKPNDIK